MKLAWFPVFSCHLAGAMLEWLCAVRVGLRVHLGAAIMQFCMHIRGAVMLKFWLSDVEADS